MGRKNHLRVKSAGGRQNFFNLGGMTMGADGVCGNRFVTFGIEIFQTRLASGSGDAALRIDDNISRIDKPAFKKRRQRKNSRRRVASGVGDEFRVANLISEKFGKAVRREG